MEDDVAVNTVVALEPVRHVSWNKDELKKFLKGKPELLAALEIILGLDVRILLMAAWGTTVADNTNA